MNELRIQELIELRERLIKMGIQEGRITENCGYQRLFWEDPKTGRTKSRTLSPAEVKSCQIKIDRRKHVERINKAIERMNKEVDRLLTEVAA